MALLASSAETCHELTRQTPSMNSLILAAALLTPSANHQIASIGGNHALAVRSTARIGLALVEQLDKQGSNSNILLSPVGITACAAMLRSGATGDCLTEMNKVLGCEGASVQSYGSSWRDLLSTYINKRQASPFRQLHVTLFSPDAGPSSEFVQHVRSNFDCAAEFANLQSSEAISGWNKKISDFTGGMIQSALSDSDPVAKMVMFVANLFSCQWQTTFDNRPLRGKPFYGLDGKVVNISYMIGRFNLPTWNSSTGVTAGFPFSDNRTMFVVSMPTNGGSIQSSAREIFARTDWSRPTSRLSGVIGIPGFTLESKVPILPVLASLGLKHVNVDGFGNLATNVTGLSSITTQSKIVVSEQGVRAASVTVAVGSGLGGGNNPPQPEYDFLFDHPFVFAIVDTKTNAVLFVGKYANPNGR